MITYNFSNLQTLADHFESRATEYRRQAKRLAATRVPPTRSAREQASHLIVRAAELENVIGILRSTRIEPRGQGQ